MRLGGIFHSWSTNVSKLNECSLNCTDCLRNHKLCPMADTAEVCRTCLSPQALGPLFPDPEEHSKVQFAFYLTTGLQIDFNDGLPQSICKYCNKTMESLLLFRFQSRLAHSKLQQQISADQESNLSEGFQDTIMLKLDATSKLTQFYCSTFDIPDMANYMHPNKSDDEIIEKVENLPMLDDLLDLYKITPIKYESSIAEDCETIFGIKNEEADISNVDKDTMTNDNFLILPTCDELIDSQETTIIQYELNSTEDNLTMLNHEHDLIHTGNVSDGGDPLGNGELQILHVPKFDEIKLNNVEDNSMLIKRTEGILNTVNLNIDIVADKLPERNDVLYRKIIQNNNKGKDNLHEPKRSAQVNKMFMAKKRELIRLAQIHRNAQLKKVNDTRNCETSRSRESMMNVKVKKNMPSNIRRNYIPILENKGKVTNNEFVFSISDELLDSQGTTIIEYELNSIQDNLTMLNPEHDMVVTDNIADEGDSLTNSDIVNIHELDNSVLIKPTESILNAENVNTDTVNDALPEPNGISYQKIIDQNYKGRENLNETKMSAEVNKMFMAKRRELFRLAQIQKNGRLKKKELLNIIPPTDIPILLAQKQVVQTNVFTSLADISKALYTPYEYSSPKNKDNEITKYQAKPCLVLEDGHHEYSSFKKKDNEITEDKAKPPRRDYPQVEYDFTEFEKRCIDLVDGPFNRFIASISDIKNFKCKICGVTRMHFATFTEHAQLHLGYSHICEFCGKGCTTKRYLRLHIQIHHTREFDYHCPHCDFKAASSSYINNHIKTVHIKQRTCICKECGKAYFSNAVLRQHIRWIHTGKDKPYKCDQCPLRFPYAPDLKYHKKIKHILMYKYYCHICKKVMSSVTMVRRHYFKVHRIPREQQVKKVQRWHFGQNVTK